MRLSRRHGLLFLRRRGQSSAVPSVAALSSSSSSSSPSPNRPLLQSSSLSSSSGPRFPIKTSCSPTLFRSSMAPKFLSSDRASCFSSSSAESIKSPASTNRYSNTEGPHGNSVSNSSSSSDSAQSGDEKQDVDQQEFLLLEQAFPEGRFRTHIRQVRSEASCIAIPLSTTADDVFKAAMYMRLAHSKFARWVFKHVATIQVESSNLDEDAGEICSLDSLRQMGWLRLGRRTDVTSPYSRRESGSVETRKAARITTLPRQEIGLGRLVPPLGRSAPVLYGPAEWHKFRWACEDYDWVTKLAVSVVIEESPRDIDQEISREDVRNLRIKTEMWMEHTSYLAHILLLPTWWILAKPLCGFIHYGIVDNVKAACASEDEKLH